MAYRAEKHGLAAEYQAKVKSKYDADLSHQILAWIAEITGENINTDGGEENFWTVLKDGSLLCKLANGIKPNTIKKFQANPTMPFKCMDNINSFLVSLDNFEVSVEDRFQTVDLWEKVNLNAVQICLAALGRKAPKFGQPGFGPKEAEENKREFSEEQLRQGETIINLQYGSNKGANASGINFGQTRKM